MKKNNFGSNYRKNEFMQKDICKYMFKANNRNTRKKHKAHSKSAIKTPKLH